MKTFMANAGNITRKWYIIDAAGQPLGRVASKAAFMLQGKHKPTYTPHVDTGDHIIIINCAQAVLTGHKLDQKFYHHHSGYVGGLKSIPYRQLMQKKADFAMSEAVRGMVPHTRLGRAMMKKLRVYNDANHLQEAQMPEVITL